MADKLAGLAMGGGGAAACAQIGAGSAREGQERRASEVHRTLRHVRTSSASSPLVLRRHPLALLRRGAPRTRRRRLQRLLVGLPASRQTRATPHCATDAAVPPPAAAAATASRAAGLRCSRPRVRGAACSRTVPLSRHRHHDDDAMDTVRVADCCPARSFLRRAVSAQARQSISSKELKKRHPCASPQSRGPQPPCTHLPCGLAAVRGERVHVAQHAAADVGTGMVLRAALIQQDLNSGLVRSVLGMAGWTQRSASAHALSAAEPRGPAATLWRCGSNASNAGSSYGRSTALPLCVAAAPGVRCGMAPRDATITTAATAGTPSASSSSSSPSDPASTQQQSSSSRDSSARAGDPAPPQPSSSSNSAPAVATRPPPPPPVHHPHFAARRRAARQAIANPFANLPATPQRPPSSPQSWHHARTQQPLPAPPPSPATPAPASTAPKPPPPPATLHRKPAGPPPAAKRVPPRSASAGRASTTATGRAHAAAAHLPRSKPAADPPADAGPPIWPEHRPAPAWRPWHTLPDLALPPQLLALPGMATGSPAATDQELLRALGGWSREQVAEVAPAVQVRASHLLSHAG